MSEGTGLSKRTAWQLLLLLLIAAALRLLLLGSKSLWFDEGFSVMRAAAPLADIWSDTWARPESHPPLYYTLLHYWIGWLGRGETAVRLPSALMSILNVALLYGLGLRLAGRRVAVIAAALLALSPLSVWYAQEARMYVFVTGAGLLYALLLTWDSWWALPAQAAALALGSYFDYTMLPLWAGLSAVWLAAWWRGTREARPLLIWLAGTGIAALLFWPWVHNFRRVLESFSDIHIFAQLNRSLGLPFFSTAGYLLLMLGGALLLFVAALLLPRLRQRPRLHLILGLLTLLFVAAVTVLAPLPRFYGLKRLLLQIWPYMLLLAATFLAGPGAWRRRAVIALLALSLAASLVTLRVPKDDWRGAVTLINGRAQAPAAVYFDPAWNDIMGRYYPLAISGRGVRDPEQIDLTAPEIWLIAPRFPGQLLPATPSEAYLDANAALLERFPLYRLEVRRYAPGVAD